MKSSVTLIFSFGPNLAHLITNCEAISCISSNIPRIDIGPNAASISVRLPKQVRPPTWHQNSMCNLPIVFSRVCREQSIFNPISNLFQWPRHRFRKAFLVADFVHEFVGGDEEPLFAAEVELEDRACRPCSQCVFQDLINRDCTPYVSANRLRLLMESAGSISLRLPSNGRPGGPGMGVAILK